MQIYSFIPEKTGYYHFYAIAYSFSEGHIYDEDMNELVCINDGLSSSLSFTLKCILFKDKQYFLSAYSNNQCTVIFEKINDLGTITIGETAEVYPDYEQHFFSFVPEVSGICYLFASAGDTYISAYDSSFNVLPESYDTSYRFEVTKDTQYYISVITYASALYSIPSFTLDGVVSWSVSDDTLTISGRGGMNSCYPYGNVPWPETIKNVIVDPGITTIGSKAFSGLDLESIVIPYSVTEIYEKAFYECTGLSNIFLPSSIRTIYSDAFKYCYIPDIYFEGSQEEWDNIAIMWGNNSLQESTIHFNIQTINLSVPSDTVSIESEAFKGLQDGLTVYIPATTLSIAPDAFSGVKFLTIYGTPDTAAETFANEQGYRFVPKK